MASKSMTCPALLLFLAMTLVVAAQSQLQFPCPPGCKGNIELKDVKVQDVDRFIEEVLDQAGDLQVQTIPCPLGCKGDIDVRDIDVQDMERWRERILAAIDF
ncbi:unnamed protein product [Urochloa humidicola]